MALTVLSLLDDTGFEGGGTEYWHEDGEDTFDGLWDDAGFAIRLHPVAGAAVLFHGELWHAGAAVTEGVRYLLVSSFSSKKGGG